MKGWRLSDLQLGISYYFGPKPFYVGCWQLKPRQRLDYTIPPRISLEVGALWLGFAFVLVRKAKK